MAAFFVAWPLLRRRRNVRWLYLVAASFFFYGWWDWRFLFLILASGLIDYFASLAMVRQPRLRKLWLVASLCGNVGALAVFKYLDFAIANANWLLGLLGVESRIGAARLILPVGISFYTFQSMSYTIDVYRGRLTPTRNVFHFFAYLSMFPQLVAGPIVRAADLLPQLAEDRRVTTQQRFDGLRLIAYGFFKKVVVADGIAPYVVQAFGSGSPAAPVGSSAYWWLTMLAFTYQIYCDFSGYSDIARGLGRWMGYEFPVNFDHPYIAGSFRNFWQRWHISLSSWFRDYVYFPLGGSRRGPQRAMLYVWITMLLSGLWHGANWTFVIWAALHAAYLSVERVTGWPKRLARVPIVGRHAGVLVVFLLTLLAWVFFRATTIGQAWRILTVMFDLARWNADKVHIPKEVVHLILLMIARQLWFHFGLDDRRRWRRWLVSAWATFSRLRGKPVPHEFGRLRAAVGRVELLGSVAAAAGMPLFLALLLTACVFMRGAGSAFIYFQF